MDEITVMTEQLPDTIEDLSKFVLADMERDIAFFDSVYKQAIEQKGNNNGR